MTAARLKRYEEVNRSALCHGESADWRRTFNAHTVDALIEEINRLRCKAGEIPTYMSNGTPAEELSEMLDY